MLLTGWGRELFEGKIFRSIPYFILSMLGAIYSIYTYILVARTRDIVASKGIIPEFSSILTPFIKMLVIGTII